MEILCLGSWLEDSELQLIAKWMPALYELHVSAGFISEVGMRSLVEKQGVPLRKIAGRCRKMPEIAVKYAQANEVVVDMRCDSPFKTKAKIQYNHTWLHTTQPYEIFEAFRTGVADLGLDPKL